MPIEYINRPTADRPYSGNRLTLLDADVSSIMAHVLAIDLIENGDRAALELWQKNQLTNLLRHAHAESKFWRARMPDRLINADVFEKLPVLDRNQLTSQVKAEGCLIAKQANSRFQINRTSGSTGKPLEIYSSAENGYYNGIRTLAQYFINGLSFDENRTRISLPRQASEILAKRQKMELGQGWIGQLGKLYRSGLSKTITYAHDNESLVTELKKHPVGYLISPARYVEILIDQGGYALMEDLKIKCWIHMSDYRNPNLLGGLKRLGITCLSSYSADEAGPIAYECRHQEGVYHIAHTNVVVEEDESVQVNDIDGRKLNRLLVTHLHSYATPIIRYDIGDFGRVMDGCACGHKGKVIAHVFGRGKHFLKCPDGKTIPFYVSPRVLRNVCEYAEYRMRQTEIDTISLELCRKEELTPEQVQRLVQVIKAASDEAFKVTIKTTPEIDWSDNPKRLVFTSPFA
jgi:phenylacetate-CoA ligase